MAQSPAPVDASLDRHEWTHRVILVFAPSDTSAALQEQRAAFKGHDDGFRDRDLRLYTVVEDETSRLRKVPSDAGTPLTERSAHRLREQLDVAAGQSVTILIGKDGTVKRRETPPVKTQTLFDQIDAMPMRQREMQDGG